MVPEKGRKGRQASLADAPEGKPDDVDRMVAQAFDSDPKVRLRVAEELGRVDDPRAIFALIELSSDKEEAVKAAAQRSLGQFKEEEEAIVSLEKLFAERKEAKKPEPAPEVRQRMMPTIERLFSHYDQKKRESAKRKLLPSLEKLFGFSSQNAQGADPLLGVEKIGQPAASHPQREEERPALPQNAENFPFGKHEEPPEKKDTVALDEDDTQYALEGQEEGGEPEAPKSRYYELAYRIATTPGMGKAELKREQNRLLSNFKRELGLAFRMAEEKAKEEGLASFSNLKPGMKNLSFAEMQISSISDMEYGARKKPFARIALSDGRREVALLVPHERARGISPLDRLSLRGVAVDFLVESNTVVLVAKNKSKLIVVK